MEEHSLSKHAHFHILGIHLGRVSKSSYWKLWFGRFHVYTSLHKFHWRESKDFNNTNILLMYKTSIRYHIIHKYGIHHFRSSQKDICQHIIHHPSKILADTSDIHRHHNTLNIHLHKIHKRYLFRMSLLGIQPYIFPYIRSSHLHTGDNYCNFNIQHIHKDIFSSCFLLCSDHLHIQLYRSHQGACRDSYKKYKYCCCCMKGKDPLYIFHR